MMRAMLPLPLLAAAVPLLPEHPGLVAAVAELLESPDPAVVAEAAAALEAHRAFAEPAREALAILVARQGPAAWSAGDPALRRSHQRAIRTLLALGDERALPSVIAALESGVDVIRAVSLLGELPADVRPHLRAFLHRPDPPGPVIAKLAELGGPSEVPAITAALAAAAAAGNPDATCTALSALANFGPAAKPAIDTIRTVTEAHFTEPQPAQGWLNASTAAELAPASPDAVRPMVAKALWAVTGQPDEVLPLLLALLAGDIPHQLRTATDLLRTIGPSAAAAVPRLRAQLFTDNEWTRVHIAETLWELGGEPEAPAVLIALIRAATTNPNTATRAAACLAAMRAAASPALVEFRAAARKPGRFYNLWKPSRLARLWKPSRLARPWKPSRFTTPPRPSRFAQLTDDLDLLRTARALLDQLD